MGKRGRPTKEVAGLRSQVEELSESYERMMRTKFSIPKVKARKTKGNFARVILPDVHGCYADKRALSVAIEDIREIQPAEIVILGDFIDCGGFLAAHHTQNYIAECAYTYEDDLNAGNTILDAIQDAAPNATIHFLEGNHERRVERWCITTALRQQRDAALLLRQFSPEVMLHIKERGINYYRQGEFYQGISLPSTIRLGKCYFTHGEYINKHAAAKTVEAFSHNVVFGHTHRAQIYVRTNVHTGPVGGWNPGCLCRLQPLWAHTRVTDWSHGYGLQYVDSAGSFLHVNVPIVDGVSLFVPLASQISKGV